jgi:putative ABC transport system permease protein
MFGEDVPLGQSFSFHGQTFIVRGVMNEFAKAPLSLDVDFNNAIFIPYSTAQAITNNTASIYEILAKPGAADETDAAISNIRETLNKAHGNQQDFSVLKQNQNLAVSDSVLSLLTGLVGGVAAISLLVGGIGIMNVMLVSVTERMHEIGIRKAVGATNRQILNQFIVEATLLSVFGGIIGVAISFIIDGALHALTDLAPVITWQAVIIATGVSLVIGVIFGSAPAFKAARKDPIDALRNE